MAPPQMAGSASSRLSGGASFRKTPANPLAMASCRSVVFAWPVISTKRVSGDHLPLSRITSSPFAPGIWKSSIAQSGRMRLIAEIASIPFRASPTIDMAGSSRIASRKPRKIRP